ncbi:MAG TPA: type II toxin-antitoxin system VapC family toxin [Patescibacteria group bacterium]|nr:type II toxin-antitoxin system VapC family toxin [Patescibacteria group bacterium]
MNSAIARARKIYIDANIVIYFLEGDSEHQDKTAALFRHAEEHDIPLLTSEITIAECLYGAYKAGKVELVEQYRTLFHAVGLFQLIPVEGSIAERAAKIGADRRLKLIDALHVTSALGVGCDVFVTNDRGIKSMDGLRVVQMFEA